MKALFLALTLLISWNAFAANGSANISQVIQLGGGQAGAVPTANTPPLITTDSSNSMGWFVLNTRQGIAGGNRYKPWHKNGVAYQVPNGVTAKCFGFFGFTTSANSSYQLVYDTAAITEEQGAALTAGVYQSGAADAYVMTFYSTQWSSIPITFDFPQNTYPALEQSNADSAGQYLNCREI